MTSIRASIAAVPAVAIKQRGSDLGAVVDALRAVHAHDGYPADWPSAPEQWLTPGGILAAWVAVEGDVVVGHALLVVGESIERVYDVARGTGVPVAQIGGLSRLFVVPAARGAGVADALLDAVEAAAAERGLRLALEVVDDGSPAVRLYERRGWRRIAVGPASWVRPDGSRPQTAVYVRPE